MVMDPHLTERLNQHTETQGDHYRYRGAHRNLPLRTAAPDPPPPPLAPCRTTQLLTLREPAPRSP
jgi:hypothetical protein